MNTLVSTSTIIPFLSRRFYEYGIVYSTALVNRFIRSLFYHHHEFRREGVPHLCRHGGTLAYATLYRVSALKYPAPLSRFHPARSAEVHGSWV